MNRHINTLSCTKKLLIPISEMVWYICMYTHAHIYV